MCGATVWACRASRLASRINSSAGTLTIASNIGSSSSNALTIGGAGDTTFLTGAARKLDLSQSDPNAQIFRLSKSFRLQVGEVQQHLIGTLTLEANDDEVAGSMMSIAQGMIGLLKLQKDKPEAAKFLQAIALKQDGASLVLTIDVPTDDVVNAMKASEERKAAKAAQKAEKEEKN